MVKVPKCVCHVLAKDDGLRYRSTALSNSVAKAMAAAIEGGC